MVPMKMETVATVKTAVKTTVEVASMGKAKTRKEAKSEANRGVSIASVVIRV